MPRTATLHRLTLSLTLTLALLQTAPSVLAAPRPAPRAVSSARVKQARPGFIRRVINRLRPHRDPTVPRKLKAARKGAGYVVRSWRFKAGAPLAKVRHLLEKLPADWQIGVRTSSSGYHFQEVVFTSVNKHGGYVNEQICDANLICDFGGCALNPKPSNPPMTNAGEPGKPLVTDLTTQGFITTANGWKETKLLHFNPWSASKFGGAGVVSDDLTDKAFMVSPSGC